MRLYILEDKKKIYINHFANTRRDLYCSIGSFEFKLGSNRYNINEVVAEYEDDIVVSTVLGALVGIFLGSLGIAIGAVVGYLFGLSKTSDDHMKADTFNKSIVSHE